VPLFGLDATWDVSDAFAPGSARDLPASRELR